jgi:tetratricopeptide (TPR) repeat protein/predicted Ser/Thr protein kinase
MLQQVGRYKVLKQLGKGAMGVVYLADDPLLNRQVAIKSIDLAVEDDASREFLRGRLLRDARAAASLTHANIVGVYDVVVEGDSACIVMEYVAGEDLASYLARDPVPDSQFTAHIIRAMAAALDYTHSRGIVHRDVKPANVMLDAARTPKITDFGIARIAEGGAKTMTGTVMGTIEYMAPEQIKGEAVDGRADQFALGVVVYRMLTGATLYGSQSMATMAYKIVNEPAAPVRSRNAALPVGVDSVVAKALAKAPGDRYPNCLEFADALAGALAGETRAAAVEVPTMATVMVTPPPAAPPAQPPPLPARKNGSLTVLVAVGMALAAGGIAGVVIWWKPWSKPAQSSETAVIAKPPAEVTAPPAVPTETTPVRKSGTAPDKPPAGKSAVQQAEAAAMGQPVDELAPDTQPPPADAPKPAVEAFDRGRDLMKRRQFAEAVQAFTKVADIRPNWGLNYVNRGSAYQHMEQFDAAIRDYSRAILINPKLVNAYVGRAQSYVQLKQDNPAFNDFNQAITMKPDDAVALHGRAWIYLRRRAFNKSLADFNESLRLSPDNLPAYRGRAEARRGLGDWRGAQADQTKYEELSAKKAEKGG